MTNQVPRIAVVGSINMDLVIRCQRLPVPGETVMADSSREICGGKGANQAVAAARAGGEVSMIGRVGNDAFAERLVDNLKAEQIQCNGIRWSDCESGVAIVPVEESGQNSIMVVPGANGAVCPEDVAASEPIISGADVLLLQLEVPVETVAAAIELAKKRGVRVVLDPAPAQQLPDALFDVDLLCPNQSEASVLTGIEVESEKQVAAAAESLHQRGAKNVAITLGERGTWLFDGQHGELIPTIEVTAKDTTAAGDAFAGALAVRWSETGDLVEAVRFANVAGALSASKDGAQPSMATRKEIDKKLRFQS